MSHKASAIFKATAAMQRRIKSDMEESLIDYGKLIRDKVVDTSLISINAEDQRGTADTAYELINDYRFTVSTTMDGSHPTDPVKVRTVLTAYHDGNLVGQKQVEGTLLDKTATTGYLEEVKIGFSYMFDLIWLANMNLTPKGTECAKH